MTKNSPGNSVSRDAQAALLLAEAQLGSREALGSLLEQFRPALLNLADDLLASDLRQKVAPSDLVQETCIDAMSAFPHSDIPHLAGLQAWLTTLLTHNVIDWQRRFRSAQKRDVRREVPLYDQQSKRYLLHAVLRSESLPESAAIAEEAKSALRQALDRLPRAYREIISLRSQRRLSWRKIAALINRSEDGARMAWKRAVRRLDQEMRKPT